MKLKSLLILTLLLLTSMSMIADEKPIKAKLNSATVFFQGAELTHTLSAQLANGENTLLVEGLSPQINLNSLSIKTSKGILVTASEFSIDYLSSGKVAGKKLKEIEDSLKIYDEQRTVLYTKITSNQKMSELLEGGIGRIGGTEKGVTVEELSKSLEYYDTKSVALTNDRLALGKELQKVEERIALLTSQQQEEGGSVNKQSGILKLTINASAATSADFTISYYTPTASWTPYYDINAESTTKPLVITTKSKVRQFTGLDWEKVKLTLSTSSPNTSKVAPLFSAWYLYDRNLNIVASKSMQKRSSSNDFYMAQNRISYDEDVSEMAVEAPMALKEMAMADYVQQAETDLNMSFDIAIPYTIAGNGKEQNIELTSKTVNASFKHYATPKLSPETFVIAEISDWQKLGLMSANANITFDGTFVGETYIEANSANEKLALTLGVDKRVNVKREKLVDNSSKRFMGSTITQESVFKITVRNNQNNSINLVLKDQYPLSRQDDVKVELLKDRTSKWTHQNEDVGVISWEESLDAGQQKEYSIGYTVKSPKGMNLNL